MRSGHKLMRRKGHCADGVLIRRRNVRRVTNARGEGARSELCDISISIFIRNRDTEVFRVNCDAVKHRSNNELLFHLRINVAREVRKELIDRRNSFHTRAKLRVERICFIHALRKKESICHFFLRELL